MSYQPPPPPSPGPGRPAAGFDPKSVNPLDWGIVGAGALAFIFSFVSYYTVDINFGRFGGAASDSVSAWHGFFGWFAVLAALVGTAAIAVALFMPTVQLPFAARLIGLVGYAVATVSVILALFVIPDGGAGDLPGVDTGHGLGYWVSLVVIIAGLGMSLMRFQATGGQLPGGLQGRVPNVGGYGPQGGMTGSRPAPPPAAGSAPPPPPGYGPPQ